MNSYDILFMGGGPAGYEGAILAAKRGLKAAVIEMDQVGGTCLQRGCIPTKTILHSAKLIKEIQNSSRIGVEVSGYSASYPAILSRKNRVVSKLTRAIEAQFKQHGVDLIKGRGMVLGNEKVAVNDQEFKAKHLVIATGSRATDLPFLKFDGRSVLSSDDVLTLQEIPPRLLVVGAGAVGIEWSFIFNYLGSEVTMVEIMEQVLPGSDREVADILKNEMTKQGIRVYTSSSIADPHFPEAGGIDISIHSAEKSYSNHFSHLLLAVGRRPNTSGMGLETTGVAIDSKGFVEVDENLRTGCSSIFACGDIVGPPLLAHKASHQALSIVDYLARGIPPHHHPLPAAVFSFPEIASVGLSENEAQRLNAPFKVGRFPYSAGSRSNAIEEKSGLIKIIANTENTLIGAHIVGAEASELLPLLTYAVQNRIPADAFREMVFIHPTLSEGIWEALGSIAGFSVHI